jgi:hypothetical protein
MFFFNRGALLPEAAKMKPAAKLRGLFSNYFVIRKKAFSGTFF